MESLSSAGCCSADAKGYEGLQKKLFDAVRENDIEALKLLLGAGADVNAKDRKNNTALHYAAKYNRIEAVQLLLGAGADVNAKGLNDNTALHYAAKDNHIEALELLLGAGAYVNAAGYYGYTPLHSAVHSVINDNIEPIRILVSSGADVNATDDDNNTVLHHAARYDLIEALKLLLGAGADVNAKNRMNNTALHYAVKDNGIEALELLLGAGADVNAKGLDNNTALHYAANKGNLIEAGKLLLGAGADVNAKDRKNNTALHYAVKDNRIEALKLLLSAGADVNAKGLNDNTALHNAAYYDHIEALKLLLGAGADVNVKDIHYQTALHLAVYNGCIEPVRLLLSSGADVNARDLNHYTPFHHGCFFRRCFNDGLVGKGDSLDISRLLLEHGANVKMQNVLGETVTKCGFRLPPVDVLELLFEYGAGLEKCDTYYCCSYGDSMGRMPYDECEWRRRYDNPPEVKHHDHLPIISCSYYFCRMKEYSNILHSGIGIWISTHHVHVFERHFLKMQVAGVVFENGSKLVDPPEKNIDWSLSQREEFRERCRAELDKMATEKVGETDVIFESIWLQRPVAVCLIQALPVEECKAKFPIYGEMLRRRYVMALMELSKEFFLLTDLPELPVECVEEIFRYLPAADRLILATIRAGSSRGQSEDQPNSEETSTSEAT